MGYDLSRFQEEVDEELKCPICCCILESAVQSPECEHTFCSFCINEWLSRQSSCPVDRQPLNSKDLKPAPRVLRNFLAKLEIKCDFASFGCPTVMKLEFLSSHCNECDFNPYKPVACEKGCGLVLLRNQVDGHNCLSDLRELVGSQRKQIDEMKTSMRVQEEKLTELKANLKRIQDHDIGEHQRQIQTLQQQLNRVQQHVDTMQKTQQVILTQQQQQRASTPVDVDEDCDCEVCDPQPRSCFFASTSGKGLRKRTGSWKDMQLAKRRGKPDAHYERSTSSPYDESQCIRRNYYHHSPHHHPHQASSSTVSDQSVAESSSTQLHQQLITFYGSIITVNVSDDEKIDSVKDKIATQESICPEQQLLFYAGLQLEDDRSLFYYNINSESSRHLVLRLRDGMKICVKTLSDKTIEVQVDPSETIEIVKVKIHEQEGISPCDQRLLLDGRDLADLRTLSDYGIKHLTTLQLDLHLGGPCPICQTQFKNNVPPTHSTGKGACTSSSNASSSSAIASHGSPNHSGGKHDRQTGSD